MTSPQTLDYPSSLSEYAVSANEFLRQHSEYHVLCTGIAVFDKGGKLLLVRRSPSEKAFPNFWEVPGGKVDDTDESILHAAARELKEEAGLQATRVLSKVAQFTFEDGRRERPVIWLKLIFAMEVESTENIILDPVEHSEFLWASEEEVMKEAAGDIQLSYVSPPNKDIKLEAFRLHRETLQA